MELTNPVDLSKTKGYESLQDAEIKLKELEDGKIEGENEIKTLANYVYNTASNAVSKLREKYKNDKPLSDFQKNSMKQAFNWDDEKVRNDPENKKAQELMGRARKFL